MKVIELNDNALTVYDENGKLCSSAGFARDNGKSLILGDEAEAECKLHPTQSYNKFWHQLSVEPLNNSSVRVRHMADLAFAHLQQVAAQAGIKENEPVMIVVPRSFSREQLGILLGIAKPAGLSIAALLNLALFSSKAYVSSTVEPITQVIHADMQQHQVVLTSMVVSGENGTASLTVDSVVQVPGVGWQNILDSLMLLVSDLFVEQCRLNPQKNASTEQQLYDKLPTWLKQSDEDSTLSLELVTADQTYSAKLPRASLIEHLQSFYTRLSSQIDALEKTASVARLLDSRIAGLPSAIAALLSENSDRTTITKGLQETDLADGCESIKAKAAELGREDSPLQIFDSVEVLRINSAFSQSKPKSELFRNPTHALLGNTALAVDDIRIGLENSSEVNATAGGRNNPSGTTLNFLGEQGSDEKLEQQTQVLGRIETDASTSVTYLVEGSNLLRVNQQETSSPQRLYCGDKITVQDSTDALLLIEVR